MHSELHERLEYLVNYSSQLIFVSGESIAEQQKTLEAFVFQQHDDTEIAYLTAQDNMDISDYRRQLCRQLLGQVVGSFVRPLNELLSDLNGHNGPILIAITQAQHLPDKLLQELWDLVLQSRFAGNKQHLNVLLFANSAWAEKAKQWLPAKNTETPLIISSQSVMSEQPRFESDLDKMIASRREAFQAHLDNRQQENAITFSNPLKSKWLYISILAVFLVTFSGLVYWQYGDKLASLFTPINSDADIADTPQAVPGSAYKNLLDEADASRPADTDERAVAEPLTTDATGNESAPENTKENIQESGDIVAQGPNVAVTNIPKDDSATLVTDWKEAISNLENSTTNVSSVQAISSTGDNTINASNEEIGSQPDTPITNNAVQTAEETTQQVKGAWISANEFAIQMLAMKDVAVLNDFLEENGLNAVSRTYKTQRYGGDWYVVVANQTYPTLDAARTAQASLPSYPGKNNAFVKSGSQILSEIALSQ
ncbi:MAG: cell division protein DamX [Pseudomonadota bacterium]|nr:cell division protein DamX [Pseudomonadota bacterium]